MSIKEFLKDFDSNAKLRTYFGKPELLKESLVELDGMIGMRQIKVQIIKQVKTFVASKARGIYKDNDRKHCLLLGPPGCGKTTVCKILCKVWIGMGFIGHQDKQTKVKGFLDVICINKPKYCCCSTKKRVVNTVISKPVRK